MCATPRRWVTTLGRQPAAAGPCRLPRRPPDRPGSRRVWCEGDAAAGPEIHAPPTTQLPLPKPRSRAGRPRLQRGAAARCRRSPPATVWCGVRSVHGRLVMGRPASPPLPYRRRCAAAADPPTPEGAAGALPHPPPPHRPRGWGRTRLSPPRPTLERARWRVDRPPPLLPPTEFLWRSCGAGRVLARPPPPSALPTSQTRPRHDELVTAGVAKGRVCPVGGGQSPSTVLPLPPPPPPFPPPSHSPRR